MRPINDKAVIPVETMNREAVRILLETYQSIAKSSPCAPNIDYLYERFKFSWLEEMHEFVITNADAYVIDITEISAYNLEVKLQEWGFPMPSLKAVHQALNEFNVCYYSLQGELVNSPVVDLW